jgi:hypothetical protein
MTFEERAEMAKLSRRTLIDMIFGPLSFVSRGTAKAAATVSAVLMTGKRADAQAPQPVGRITSERVDRAIRDGVRHLKSLQESDGSWPNPGNHHQHTVGPTSLATYALLQCGEPADSNAIVKALDYLTRFTPDQIDGCYAVGLQTMVYCHVDSVRFSVRIMANVAWLEKAQVKKSDRVPSIPGSWAHTSDKSRQGDNSSGQYAMLGLHAAAMAGFAVNPDVWAMARKFLTVGQNRDGSWPYSPGNGADSHTASMTCAGISGMYITGTWLNSTDGERLENSEITGCGNHSDRPEINRGLKWLGSNFSVSINPGATPPRFWHYYYLYGLERVGRFLGIDSISGHDWFREGAAEIVANQDVLTGGWAGISIEREGTIATSFALLFLATGRAPLLMNKLVHGPGEDWNNDVDDVRNLVAQVSADWKHTLTWRAVDPGKVSTESLLFAPISFVNGHESPVFSPESRQNMRAYIDNGGVILAEACCGDPRFDKGFREFVKELFPEENLELRPLDSSHSIWRTRFKLTPELHPLWGVDLGCRTALIYSPKDLSCYWNQMTRSPANERVILASRIGQNIVDYVTGRELPADKLVLREVASFNSDSPRRGVLKIAKIQHAGDWNVAKLAVPQLARSLSKLGIAVDLDQKELRPSDPAIVNYPLAYMHGRLAFTMSDTDKEALRRHIDPGQGVLMADAACGSAEFDRSFRQLVAELFPDKPLTEITKDDPLLSKSTGYDLSQVQYSGPAGAQKGYPMLEGIKIGDKWAVIYSKYDIGCALQRHAGYGCVGYVYDSALQIATNIVLHSMMP